MKWLRMTSVRRCAYAAVLAMALGIVSYVPASAAVSGLRVWSSGMMLVNESGAGLSIRADGVVIAAPKQESDKRQRWTGNDSWFGATGSKVLRNDTDPGRCLSVSVDPAKGTDQLVLAPCVSDYTQDWTLAFDPAKPDHFRIVNRKSLKVVTIGEIGAPVEVVTLRPSVPDQVFYIDNCQQCG